MEIKNVLEITVKNNDKRPNKCSLECPYMNILGCRDFPEDARCELFQKPLKCYLSFENCRWLWVERCDKCIENFKN